MAGEELAALGRELRVQADAWLADLLDGWALPGPEAAAEPLAELSRLERDVVALAGQAAMLDMLASTLTAGFPGEPAPLLADAPADEADPHDAPDARPRAAAQSASPAPPRGGGDREGRQGGEGGSASAHPPNAVRKGRSVDRGMDAANPPSPARGIRGLGDLAAIAGAGGLDLDADRADSPPPSQRERRDGGWHDAPSSAARPESMRQDARWADADASPRLIDRDRDDVPRMERVSFDGDAPSLAPQPSRLPTWELPGAQEAANRLRPSEAAASSGDAEDRAQGDLPRANPSPSRADTVSAAPIRLPTRDRREVAALDASRRRDAAAARGEGDRATSAAERWGDPVMTLGGLEPVRLALPFLDPPDQPPANASSGDNDSADADRVSVAASREAERGWTGSEARASGPADAARLPASIGRRIPPAAEILSALGGAASAVDSPKRPADSGGFARESPSAERPSREAGANPPAGEADAGKPAIAREVDAVTRGVLPEPPGWPDLDVQDLMDALAREVMHEYRRHYGDA